MHSERGLTYYEVVLSGHMCVRFQLRLTECSCILRYPARPCSGFRNFLPRYDRDKLGRTSPADDISLGGVPDYAILDGLQGRPMKSHAMSRRARQARQECDVLKFNIIENTCSGLAAGGRHLHGCPKCTRGDTQALSRFVPASTSQSHRDLMARLPKPGAHSLTIVCGYYPAQLGAMLSETTQLGCW